MHEVGGVPVLARVAANLRPMWPDLPTPETMTRPLEARIRSTAAAKPASSLVGERVNRVGLDLEDAAGEGENALVRQRQSGLSSWAAWV
jgi:hypothetical protein